MGIDRHPAARLLGPGVGAPSLGVAEEELLLGREPARCSRPIRMRLRIGLHRREGELEASEVGDVLPERQRPVHVQVVDRHVPVELLLHARDAIHERLA